MWSQIKRVSGAYSSPSPPVLEVRGEKVLQPIEVADEIGRALSERCGDGNADPAFLRRKRLPGGDRLLEVGSGDGGDSPRRRRRAGAPGPEAKRSPMCPLRGGSWRRLPPPAAAASPRRPLQHLFICSTALGQRHAHQQAWSRASRGPAC